MLTDKLSMNDDTLISKLISETYTESQDKDQPNNFVDLRNYFEKRLNEVDFISLSDYLGQNEIHSVLLEYRKDSQCYRMIIKNSVLDFPSNWSVFKELKSQDIIYIDQSLDQDFLLDIFAELNGSQENLALLNDEGSARIVFLSLESSKEHIQWMRGYFEKRNQDQEKAAA